MAALNLNQQSLPGRPQRGGAKVLTHPSPGANLTAQHAAYNVHHFSPLGAKNMEKAAQEEKQKSAQRTKPSLEATQGGGAGPSAGGGAARGRAKALGEEHKSRGGGDEEKLVAEADSKPGAASLVASKDGSRKQRGAGGDGMPRRGGYGRSQGRAQGNDGRRQGWSSQEAKKKSQFVAQNYKTEVCRSHRQTGTCEYGKSCQFAHGIQELRPRHYGVKYKTQECKNYHAEGYCRFGSRCKFIHDESRIRVADDEFWLVSPSENLVRVEVVDNAERQEELAQLVSTTNAPPGTEPTGSGTGATPAVESPEVPRGPPPTGYSDSPPMMYPGATPPEHALSSHDQVFVAAPPMPTYPHYAPDVTGSPPGLYAPVAPAPYVLNGVLYGPPPPPYCPPPPGGAHMSNGFYAPPPVLCAYPPTGRGRPHPTGYMSATPSAVPVPLPSRRGPRVEGKSPSAPLPHHGQTPRPRPKNIKPRTPPPPSPAAATKAAAAPAPAPPAPVVG